MQLSIYDKLRAAAAVQTYIVIIMKGDSRDPI